MNSFPLVLARTTILNSIICYSCISHNLISHFVTPFVKVVTIYCGQLNNSHLCQATRLFKYYIFDFLLPWNCSHLCSHKWEWLDPGPRIQTLPPRFSLHHGYLSHGAGSGGAVGEIKRKKKEQWSNTMSLWKQCWYILHRHL